MRRKTDRRDLFELARRAKLTVGELVAYMGDRSLGETSARVAIAESLGMEGGLKELGSRMSAPELNDWLILYGVEVQAAELEAENERRRREGP